MGTLAIHSRIAERHPELTEGDVVHAWENAIVSAPRLGKDRDEYVSVGFDKSGRMIEMAAVRDPSGTWTVFHAMAPPSKKTFHELGIGR